MNIALGEFGLIVAVQQDFCQHPRDDADMWLYYCSWRWFSDFGKFESCQEVRHDSLLGSRGTWVVVFADLWGILDSVCSAVEMSCCGRPSTGCQRTLLKIHDNVIAKMIEEKPKVKPRQLLAVTITTIKADHYSRSYAEDVTSVTSGASQGPHSFNKALPAMH